MWISSFNHQKHIYDGSDLMIIIVMIMLSLITIETLMITPRDYDDYQHIQELSCLSDNLLMKTITMMMFMMMIMMIVMDDDGDDSDV